MLFKTFVFRGTLNWKACPVAPIIGIEGFSFVSVKSLMSEMRWPLESIRFGIIMSRQSTVQAEDYVWSL